MLLSAQSSSWCQSANSCRVSHTDLSKLHIQLVSKSALIVPTALQLGGKESLNQLDKTMAGVRRNGRTSAAVKKARLEAERSKVILRMDELENTEKIEGYKKKNRFDFIFKLYITGDTVSLSIEYRSSTCIISVTRVLGRLA